MRFVVGYYLEHNAKHLVFIHLHAVDHATVSREGLTILKQLTNVPSSLEGPQFNGAGLAGSALSLQVDPQLLKIRGLITELTYCFRV